MSQIATFQWGLVTARQAVDAQVSRWDLNRLATDGAIESVGYGVYRMTGAPLTPFLDLKVAWLQLDPATVAEERIPGSGVVSHTSAAALYGVGDFEIDVFEFTRPARFRSRRADVVVHVAQVAELEIRRIDQLLVTGPSRLAHDLLADHHDGDHVGRVFTDMIAVGLIGANGLAAASAPFAHSYGFDEDDGTGLVNHLTKQVAG